ncbi:hypothetical protein [Geosporobacter ferrireducens]|uniref:hypothetical protein n=1 Tax=Geosporobacter ferrireducens TaxID=1424294 RepID=UPI00139ED09C|nr:hypothetical protein [Geosporobacter ferrireducens]MTI53773.1 hypothetical protein [Geosporobacter ferrireducens]
MVVRKNETEIATIKKIVFAVMPEAIIRASGGGKYPFSARGLYYQVRPLIQVYTNKELSYEYFTPPLLTEYQELFGAIEGLYYEARGILIEPHTGREIPLGTREVAAYKPEPYTFNKILYVEKTGLLPILRAGRLAEKYDMALMSSQGFANRSAKELLADFEREFEDITILCLHDCDISGHEIARALSEETRTSKHKIKVIDIGLSVEDVKEADLQIEKVNIRYTPPAEFVSRLSRLERRFFLGKSANSHNGVLKGSRCELNAFRPDDLIAYIEMKLKSLGLTEKILPPVEVIEKEKEKTLETKLQEEVRNEIIKRLELDELVRNISKQLIDQNKIHEDIDIKDDIQEGESWRDVVNQKTALQIKMLIQENMKIFESIV